MAFSPSTITKLSTATLAGPPTNSSVSENHKDAIDNLRTKMGDPGATSIVTQLANKLGVVTWATYTPTLSGVSLGTGGLVAGEKLTIGSVITFFKIQINFGSQSGFSTVPVRVGMPSDATGIVTGPAMYLTPGNPGFRSGVWSNWADAQRDSIQFTFEGADGVSNQLGNQYPEQPSQGAYLFAQGWYRPA